MDQNLKFCRFCLFEERSDSDNLLVNFVNTPLLLKNLENIGIFITRDDNIPSLACENCIEFIEKIVQFLERVQNTKKVLYEIYNSNEKIEINEIKIIKPVKPSHSNEISINHIEEFKNETSESYDSDSNQINESIRDDDIIFQSQYCAIATRSYTEPNKTKYLNKIKNIGKGSYNSDFTDNEEIIEGKKLPDAVYFPGGHKVNIYDHQDHQNTNNGQYVFCCSKCNKTFPSRIDVIQHEKRHKVACTVCNMELLPKSLAAHMKKHTDLHKCNDCQSRHSSRAALENHYKARHAGVKGYVCHICGKQNSCQASIRRHLATHMPTKPFKCKMCSFATKSKTILKVHVLRKHSNETTNCNICKKTFKSELSLTQHKKRIHQPKKHICKHCGKSFSEKFNLDQHVTKKHSKQRVYECKECDQEFFMTQKLKDHMHTHRTGCVSCPKCGKGFFYKKYFQKHLQKCHAGFSNAAKQKML